MTAAPSRQDRMKPLEQLRSGECKFALAETFIEGETIDRRLWLFCAEPTMPGRPYCRACAAVAYRPREGRTVGTGSAEGGVTGVSASCGNALA